MSHLSTAKTSIVGDFNAAKHSAMNTQEGTKESKNSNNDQISTKSSDIPSRNFDCPVPTITIKKCGFTSHVLPSQMDICIVNDTCEIEREHYEEAKPEHVHWIQDYQDKYFDPEQQLLLKDIPSFYNDDEETNQIE
jgi:hypothetical protein|tara:strand:+ start:70 stop:477 length:408 start_codon:yes stop_codon:yes gene_type:complete